MPTTRPKSLAFVVTVVAAAVGCIYTAEAEPILWPSSAGGNDHYYEAVKTPGGCTWHAADQLAGELWWMGGQGHLATIISPAENDWIWNNLGSVAEFWLGGFQLPGSPEPDAGWTWVTNEPWDFENWRDGEPNNSCQEDHLHFHMDSDTGEWNDYDSENLASGYVVEFAPSSTPADPISWARLRGLFR